VAVAPKLVHGGAIEPLHCAKEFDEAVGAPEFRCPGQQYASLPSVLLVIYRLQLAVADVLQRNDREIKRAREFGCRVKYLHLRSSGFED
jgi:hypothetical protein